MTVGGRHGGVEAANEGLVEHPLNAGVEQRGVFEIGDGAIEPEVDGGDGGMGEVGERGLDTLAGSGGFGERGEEPGSLLEGQSEEQHGGVEAVAVGGGDLPEAFGETVDARYRIDAGAGVESSSLLRGEVGDGGVEIG